MPKELADRLYIDNLFYFSPDYDVRNTAWLYNYFMNYEITITNFQRERPITEYYEKVKKANRSPITMFGIHLVDEYLKCPSNDIPTNHSFDIVHQGGFGFQDQRDLYIQQKSLYGMYKNYVS